jgi:hypothetical protein
MADGTNLEWADALFDDVSDIDATIATWKGGGLDPGEAWLAVARQYRRDVGWPEVRGFILGWLGNQPPRKRR